MSSRKTQEEYKNHNLAAPPEDEEIVIIDPESFSINADYKAEKRHENRNSKGVIEFEDYFGHQSAVLDNLTRRARNRSRKFLRTATSLLFATMVFSTLAPLAKADDLKPIYITQIQTTGGTGKTDNDYIELFNPSDQVINLKGYRLIKRSGAATKDTLIKSWTEDTFVLPKHFYLWANSNYSGIAKAPDTVTSGTIADDNGIAIRFGANDTGSLISDAAWGKTSNGLQNISSINPKPNQSLFRDELINSNSTFHLTVSEPRNTSDQYSSSPQVTTPETLPDNANSQEVVVNTNNQVVTNTVTEQPSSDMHTDPAMPETAPIIEPSTSNDTSTPKDAVQNNPEGPVTAPNTEVMAQENNTATDASGTGTVESGVVDESEINQQVVDPDPKEVVMDQAVDSSIQSSDVNQIETFGSGGPSEAAVTTTLETSNDEVSDQSNVSAISQVNQPAVNSSSDSIYASSVNQEEITTKIEISEVLPNPAGDDKGHEVVELINRGNDTISLNNWLLDDKTLTGKPGKHALVLGDFSVLPGQVLTITVPVDKFVLNNTTDTINLYKPNQSLVDSFSYTTTKEGLSYQRILDAWQLLKPSIGTINIAPNDQIDHSIIISEIMPNPKGSDDGKEWVELYNTGSLAIDLSGFIIDNLHSTDVIGNLAVKIGNIVLQPGQYKQFIIPEEAFAFRNTGQEAARLYNSNQKLLQEVLFQNVPEGRSYAINDSNAWLNAFPSPNEKNIFMPPVSPVADVKTATSNQTTKKPQSLVPVVHTVAKTTAPSVITSTPKTIKTKTAAVVKPLSLPKQDKKPIVRKTIKKPAKKTVAIKKLSAKNATSKIPSDQKEGIIAEALNNFPIAEAHASGPEDVLQTTKSNHNSSIPWNYLAAGCVSLCAASFLVKKYTHTRNLQIAVTEEKENTNKIS